MTGVRSQVATLDWGFEPAGVVMGAGVFQILRPTSCGGVGPQMANEPLIYPAYEDSVRGAWQTVIERLGVEAEDAEAHGVIGVSVSQSWSGDVASTLELQLVGSAVRLGGHRPLARPFLSTLSTDEFLKVLLAGWVPRGIAWGITAVHVHGLDANPLLQGSAMSNAEMAVPTAGIQLARTRLDQQARATMFDCGAAGAVQMSIDLNRLPQGCGGGHGVLIDGQILGTGIVRYGPPATSISAVRNLRHRAGR